MIKRLDSAKWLKTLAVVGSVFSLNAVSLAVAQPADSFQYSVETPSAQAVAKARDAVTAGKWDQLPVLVEQAQGDTLKIYVDFWNTLGALKRAQSVQTFTAGDAFLDKYPGTYMADRLRAEWVLRAVELGEFGKVDEIGEFIWLNPQVRCSKLLAQHMTKGGVDPQVARDTFAAGNACWSMVNRLAGDRVLSHETLSAMLLDLLEVNHLRSAERLAPLVFKGNDLNEYRALIKNPQQWLKMQTASQFKGDQALLVAIALSRVARDEPSDVVASLESHWDKRLPPDMAGWVRGQVAQRSALNLNMDVANRLYKEAGDVALTNTGHEWRVRSALRQPTIDWVWVQEAIEKMPVTLQLDSAWLYWKARALQAQGHPEAAGSLYQALSNRLDFYGQLATEELGHKIVVPKTPNPVTPAELQKARDNPHLQQAVALFRQGWRPEAVPQWNFSLRGMTDRELLAAAEFAREQQLYDRVVNTSERTKDSIDFSQRFIAPFAGQVGARASAIGLDPAWVYGLIRQESRFIMDAKSVAGASGLMQLMPATARYVAKKIGMKDFHPSRVNEFDVNTELGTQYLLMVLNDLDGSQVLASAGYNAGPGRPRNWRSNLAEPVEGAIFAETIPFSETRDYVKNVLSNATYYGAVFTGEPQSLKERLGEISRKSR